MELISVRELFKNTEKYADKCVTIGGWVRNRRPSKQFGFIMLNDGTYFNPVQIVYNDSIENFQEISKINVGAALIVKGTLVLTPDAKQPFEIQAKALLDMGCDGIKLMFAAGTRKRLGYGIDDECLDKMFDYLEQNNIPFEMHIVPNGYHGMGLGNRETARYVDPSFAKWMELSILWLDRLFSGKKEEYNAANRARFID